MHRHWKQSLAQIIHCPANQQRFRTAMTAMPGLMADVAMDSRQRDPFSGFQRNQRLLRTTAAPQPRSRIGHPNLRVDTGFSQK